MTELPALMTVCASEAPVLDVLLLHGLTGTPHKTWATTSNAVWPKWLCQELPGLSMYALGYSSSIFEMWAKRDMNLHERAQNLLEHLAAYGIGQRPIAFICHSLGGILAKEMLRVSHECSDEAWRRIASNTRMAIFLATPHTGAALASVVKIIAPRLASRFVELLTNDSGYLTSLNQSYRDLAASSGFETIAYYEKYKMKGAVIVVSQESADPGVSTRPIAVDADHVSICKPESPDAFVYVSIRRHLESLLQSCGPTPFSGEDYGTPAESDRRDLLQKLIDAGREHEYQNANNLQSGFAQRYYKLGLYTDARSKSDSTLANVEQRFLTHVYTKIASGASNDEIAQALQTHVIDALCNGPESEGLSPKAVLQALYFLTGQCYIKWDAT